MHNIPQRPPFPKRPLIWGAPPTGNDPEDVASSVIAPPAAAGNGVPAVAGLGTLSAALAPVTVAVNYTTGTINTAFPNGVRVATQSFVTPIGLVSVDLSTTGVNTSDAVMAIIIAKDIGANIDIQNSTVVYSVHLIAAGATMSQRTGLSFADEVAPRIGSGEKVAIYISSSGTGFATNVATAVLTLRYFSLA